MLYRDGQAEGLIDGELLDITAWRDSSGTRSFLWDVVREQYSVPEDVPDHDHDDVLLQPGLEESVKDATAESDPLVDDADDAIILPKPKERAPKPGGIDELGTTPTEPAERRGGGGW